MNTRYVCGLAAAGAAVVLAALPAASDAAAVSLTREGPRAAPRIVFRAAPGERNRLSVSRERRGWLVFEERGAPLVGRGACRRLRRGLVRCPAQRARSLVRLGDGGDRVRAVGKLRLTVAGGSGADLLRGGRGDDLLQGGGGEDRVRGGAGSDFLNGGPGDDSLAGGEGEDHIEGDSGDDRLNGDETNGTFTIDQLYCEDGFDRAAPGGADLVDECERAAVWRALRVVPAPAIRGDEAIFRLSCRDSRGCRGRLAMRVGWDHRANVDFEIRARRAGEAPSEVRVPLAPDFARVLDSRQLVQIQFAGPGRFGVYQIFLDRN